MVGVPRTPTFLLSCRGQVGAPQELRPGKRRIGPTPRNKSLSLRLPPIYTSPIPDAASFPRCRPLSRRLQSPANCSPQLVRKPEDLALKSRSVNFWMRMPRRRIPFPLSPLYGDEVVEMTDSEFALVHLPAYLFLAFLPLPPHIHWLGASATLRARQECLRVEGTSPTKIRKTDRRRRGHEKASGHRGGDVWWLGLIHWSTL